MRGIEIATPLAEVIKARRELIRMDAPCVGCGGTLADCLASRGKDPTAPDWFGCCARGTAMAPCSHRADPRAVERLLDAIQAGYVQPVEEILAERTEEAERRKQARGPLTGPMWEQAEWWRMKDGTWIRLADMAPSHRGNTARLLLRTAGAWARRAAHADMILGGDAPDDVVDSFLREAEEREGDPQAWMAGTVLFRALTDGLAGDDARGLDPAEYSKPVCMIPDCGCSGLAHA